jgi:uncharacterized protein YqiB (DUF1249 family)
MALKTRTRKIHLAEPRSFSGLMAVYESNFRRLLRLVPEADLPFDQADSRGKHGALLRLQVLERCRFTTTVRLAHFASDAEGAAPDPDLRLRLYRDAQLVEAIRVDAYAQYAALADIQIETGDALEQQWPRNILLNKWLAFCIEQGFNFAGAGRPRRAD